MKIKKGQVWECDRSEGILESRKGEKALRRIVIEREHGLLQAYSARYLDNGELAVFAYDEFKKFLLIG